jgi:hypothetical protein
MPAKISSSLSPLYLGAAGPGFTEGGFELLAHRCRLRLLNKCCITASALLEKISVVPLFLPDLSCHVPLVKINPGLGPYKENGRTCEANITCAGDTLPSG